MIAIISYLVAWACGAALVVLGITRSDAFLFIVGMLFVAYATLRLGTKIK